MEGTERKTQLFNLKDNPEELLPEHQQKDVIAKTGNRPSKNQVNSAGNQKFAKKLQEMEGSLFKEMNAFISLSIMGSTPGLIRLPQATR